MTDLKTIFTCFLNLIDKKTQKQLLIVTKAMLAMTGRITMLSLSRWTEKGGSYRTLQRFFKSEIDWFALNWALVRTKCIQSNAVILLAGDATTVTKSGKKTHGIGRFFSSIYSRAVPGIAFQTLSLINTETRISSPILMEQILPSTAPSESNNTNKNKDSTGKKKSRGRPPGSKNKNNQEVKLKGEMAQVKPMLVKLLGLLSNQLNLVYFVYDGAFGNNAAVQMTNNLGLHLISKLLNNSALFFKYTGEYSGKGRPKQYGSRIDYLKLPDERLCSDEKKGNIRERIYQIEALHKTMSESLNVVIIHKENTVTGKCAHIILFSTDVNLSWDKVVDYYRLRFQIEFNFRDAKQHWGLEDFMVIKKQKVCNAANLSLFMVNVSQALLMDNQKASVLDLKAHYCSVRYAKEAFKILAENVQVIKIESLLQRIPILEGVKRTV